MGKIALNYIYLSKNHAGGKDQVGLNLLQGFYELGLSKEFVVICFEYSVEVIKTIAKDIEIISIKSKEMPNELVRMGYICAVNTLIIPKILKNHKIDLIYHLSCNNGLRKYNIPSSVIPHDIKAVSHRVLGKIKIPFYKYYLYRLMYALDFKHAEAIIAISDFDREMIQKHYPKYTKKIKRIYNPIQIQEAQKSATKESYLCGLNLQFHHKNIITLIKAYEKIKDQISAKLVLIGSVPKRVKYIEEYVREHQLEDVITFTGFVSEDERNSLLTNSILYVNPSMFEGFGMTAIEAMMRKTPTLVADVCANREVTKGFCSYYFPPEDETKLADQMLYCIKNPPDAEELQRWSKAMVEEYHYKKISELYMDFFEQVRKRR